MNKIRSVGSRPLEGVLKWAGRTAFLVCLLFSAVAYSAANISAIALRGDGNQINLRLDVAPGVYGGASFGLSANIIQVQLRETDPATLNGLLAQLDQNHPLVEQIGIAQDEAGNLYLLLTLRRPVVIQEETLQVAEEGVSSWSLLLSADETAAPPQLSYEALEPVELRSIRANWRRGALELELLGDEELAVEVSFDDEGRGLLLTLPGVSDASVAAALEAYNPQKGQPLIHAIHRVDDNVLPAQGIQLLVAADSPLDLVDSHAAVDSVTGEGQIRIVLVADGSVSESASVLAGIEAVADRNTVGVRLEGAEDARISSYVLESPSRLMVDLLGWSANQVADAVVRFKPGNGVQGIRYGETRLGSARIELALDPTYELAGVTLGTQVSEPGTQLRLVAAPVLSAPAGATVVDSLVTAASSLDLRYQPEHDFADVARLKISPVTLKGDFSDMPPVEQALGSRFELLSLYQSALSGDSQYRAVQADFEASLEALPQARADYLPQVGFSYQYTGARRDIVASPTLTEGRYDVPTKSWELKITQPVYRKQPLVKIEQARVSIEQARLGLLVAEQDLMLRVATGYLDVLGARDALDLAVAEKEAAEKQHQLALENLGRGLGTQTQLNDTLGRLSLSEARVIEAEDRLVEAKLVLKEMVGADVSSVRGFKGDFDAAGPSPATVEPWVRAAVEQNLVMQTRAMATEIAFLEINRQRAGHLPTLDLSASVGGSATKSMIVRGADDDSEMAQVGLTLNVPIYGGGRTSSLVREAVARLSKAQIEQEQEKRRVERIVRSTFMRVQSSSRMLEALREVAAAQESALQARLKGFRAGVISAVELLDAQSRYFSAQRDFLQVRYDYLVNRLKLKQAVGVLSRSDLEDLDSLLN